MVWKTFSSDDRLTLTLPASKGVYKFSVIINEDKVVELYVGRSSNLSTRIKTHSAFIKNLEKEYECCLDISYIETEDEISLEKLLINRLKPIYNFNSIGNKATDFVVKQVIAALDGRKQRWLAMEIRMPEQELTKRMRGHCYFTQEELEKINARLNCTIQNKQDKEIDVNKKCRVGSPSQEQL